MSDAAKGILLATVISIALWALIIWAVMAVMS